MSEHEPIRILLADDEPALCSALHLLLEQEPGLTVVGEAAESSSTLRQVAALQPDLLLIDWELTGATGTALITMLRASAPGVRIIALSSRPEARLTALAAGADAFVSKGNPPDSLLSAIHRLGSTPLAR
jgi:DNA-binding NarL/FixJ family response regulator